MPIGMHEQGKLPVAALEPIELFGLRPMERAEDLLGSDRVIEMGRDHGEIAGYGWLV